MKRIFFSFLALALFLLAGCAAKSAPKDADLAKVMETMKQKITNTQMMDLSSNDLKPNYGIDPKDVRQFAAYVDSTGTKGDEILLFEGTGSGAADRIEKDLNDRYHQKEIEMKDYLPEEYAVLQKCKVERNGNFAAMIVSPQYQDLEQIYHNALK
jgi:stress-induced morphogen